MTVDFITKKLRQCPSYFRWSSNRLANYFGCSLKTITNIKKELHTIYRKYEKNLKN